jgi:hypothetical protein
MLRGAEQPSIELAFYREQSEISSPGRYAALFDTLPTEIPALCEAVQHVLIHQFWVLDRDNYGIGPADLKQAGREPNQEINLRSTEEILEAAMVLNDRAITAPRAALQRVVGNCRDYALLLTATLRHQGIPARVRSGVARYFFPGEIRLEDHFICEWWNEAAGRWQRTDPQLDALQRRVLALPFDPADLPPGQFLDAGESYRELESGAVEPDKIGIFEFVGWPYVRYKLVSDLACVNRVEVLAWEGWGVCSEVDADPMPEGTQALFAQIAELLLTSTEAPSRFAEARALWDTHPRLQFPADYRPHYWELSALK